MQCWTVWVLHQRWLCWQYPSRPHVVLERLESLCLQSSRGINCFHSSQTINAETVGRTWRDGVDLLKWTALATPEPCSWHTERRQPQTLRIGLNDFDDSDINIVQICPNDSQLLVVVRRTAHTSFFDMLLMSLTSKFLKNQHTQGSSVVALKNIPFQAIQLLHSQKPPIETSLEQLPHWSQRYRGLAPPSSLP